MVRFQPVYTLRDLIHLKHVTSSAIIVAQRMKDGSLRTSNLSLFGRLLMFGVSFVSLLWMFCNFQLVMLESWIPRQISIFQMREYHSNLSNVYHINMNVILHLYSLSYNIYTHTYIYIYIYILLG